MTVKQFGEHHYSLAPTPPTVLITCTVACCTTPGTALRGLGTRVGQPPVSLCFIQKLCRGSEGLPRETRDPLRPLFQVPMNETGYHTHWYW